MLAAILAVVVQLALPPEHQPYDERYRDAAASAVRLLEDWFGAMPGGDIRLVAGGRRRLPADDREKIAWRNAARFLKIEGLAAGP